jgi:altronate dehydratase
MLMAIQISKKDNVATTVAEVKKGAEVSAKLGLETKKVEAKEAIPYGHKIALTRIAKGGDIVKYGEVIGRAKTKIEAGEWVHTRNTDETYTPTR